jgi:hypothetical protein
MKKIILAFCLLAFGLISNSLSRNANARSSIDANFNALIVPMNPIPPIPCHGGCMGTYPDVIFCVKCVNPPETCQMLMYYVGIGWNDVCSHLI